MKKHVEGRAGGFTLVELLVVIAIIGMLVGLLLPAVQQAREAARQMQCGNNMKNLALACLNHESSVRGFPSGGWSWPWVGDPDRGFGPSQSGGWTYSVLPFLEQNALFQLGTDGQPDTVTDTQKNGAKTCVETPVSMFNCPSRRAAKAYPFFKSFSNSAATTQVARGDYAGNIGVSTYGEDNASYSIPSDVADGSSRVKNSTFPKFESYGAICPWRSIKTSQIRDGLSNTYLLGEKWESPDFYEVCTRSSYSGGDNECLYSGGCNDVLRTCYYSSQTTNAKPVQDRPGLQRHNYFGSCHAGSFGMAMCDGSVQRVSYSIDPKMHYYLGHRSDGNVATLGN